MLFTPESERVRRTKSTDKLGYDDNRRDKKEIVVPDADRPQSGSIISDFAPIEIIKWM